MNQNSSPIVERPQARHGTSRHQDKTYRDGPGRPSIARGQKQPPLWKDQDWQKHGTRACDSIDCFSNYSPEVCRACVLYQFVFGICLVLNDATTTTIGTSYAHTSLSLIAVNHLPKASLDSALSGFQSCSEATAKANPIGDISTIL